MRFSARLAGRGFDVTLDLAAGETLAVLGPNGAGKSTLVELIAGLVRADSGSARLGDTVLFSVGGSGGREVWTPPHRRRTVLLAQEPLLFPHLSVRENVAFGPRSAGTPRAEARARADRQLAAVDATGLADRRPGTLSGGQAQRVALARSLAAEPRLLLLDEPLAAVDARLAPALRRMLRTAIAERTTLLVTHDVLDAWTLADRVVVLHGGHLVEEGPTAEVLSRPRTAFTAELAGLNLVRGWRTEAGLRTEDGVEIAGTASAWLPLGSAVLAAVSPAAVRLATPGAATEGTAAPLRVVVTDLEQRGDAVRVRSSLMAADVAPAEVAREDLTPGREVALVVDPSAVQLYSASRPAPDVCGTAG
ncbi:ABC transporter ATP-binding protein [Rathayibacter sp. VKM Ac-2878]|nr:ABC transporter ATP-binding protein [Rathayibacter sp. VKM Ac-2879]MBF4502665.1 ABC transporter ATP-binding protein [Rathayibacter sp. VKM Ac-2878]